MKEKKQTNNKEKNCYMQLLTQRYNLIEGDSNIAQTLVSPALRANDVCCQNKNLKLKVSF